MSSLPGIEPPVLTQDRGLFGLRIWLSNLGDPKRAIINPLADAIFFYGAPIWAMALVYMTFLVPDLWAASSASSEDYGLVVMLVGALTTAHLLAVVFRSHFNPDVFSRWPLRFTLVPVVVFGLLAISPVALVAASVLAIFWDVYHSGMQNFGLGRIYDMRAGNKPSEGRLLDSMMAQALYAGPIAAGASLMSHVNGFQDFDQFLAGGFGSVAGVLTTIPATVEGVTAYIRWGAITAVVLASVIYVAGYWRLARNGYTLTPQKIILLVSTGLVSVLAWVFCEPVVAFVIINLYHAVQYFAIVWGREHKTVAARLSRGKRPVGKWAVLALILLSTMVFGFWDMLAVSGWTLAYAGIVTVALMHFWYDGFIWSVRKKQV